MLQLKFCSDCEFKKTMNGHCFMTVSVDSLLTPLRANCNFEMFTIEEREKPENLKKPSEQG